MKMMDTRDSPERLESLEVNTMAYAWNPEREDKILNNVEKISKVGEKYMECDTNLCYCRT